MRKTIIKTIYAILIFMAALFITDLFMNRESVDMTAEMNDASFPLVYVLRGDQRINCMRGTSLETEPFYVYDGITPVDAKDRTLSFEMDTYSNHINQLSYEVRNTAGDRLIENGTIENEQLTGELLAFSVTLKDLLKVGEEYVFRLSVQTSGSNTICFDTRICLLDEIEKADEVIDFALDFSDRTFDKDRAAALATYLESNEEGDNTTYAKVNIHSSFAQITWGGLSVERTGKPEIQLTRINPYVADIRLKYPLTLKNGVYDEPYHICEYFQVRYGQERLYLLSYERTMNSVFQPHGPVFSNNKISLGITDPDTVELSESEDGNVFAFIKENCLYSFNTSDNKTALVFSFYDEQRTGPRETYDGSDIRILSIDETGNIRFLVRGYMNRGDHEGGVGVACYYYNSTMNTVEEEIYVPFYTSAEYLKLGMGRLAYANSSDKLFLLVDGALYRIDLLDKSYDIVAQDLRPGTYEISEDKHLVAWTDNTDPGKMQLLNLNNGKIRQIYAEGETVLRPLGFVGEDLVYGIGYESDAVTDSFGNRVYPLSRVMIEDENGEQLKSYEKSGIYVTGASVSKAQIRLTRVIKSGNMLIDTDDDYIMNDIADQETKNSIEVVATQNLEKIVQIAIKSSLSASKMKVLTPKQVLYEGQRQLFLTKRGQKSEYYYVYDVKGLNTIYDNPRDAILDAEEKNGRVISPLGACIWEKSSRSIRTQIETITETAPDPDNGVAAALEVMLKNEGVSLDCHRLLAGGESIPEIIGKNLPSCEMLNLSGCSLESVLYFVSRQKPVMALLHDGSAVLIVGYNELNTILYNPVSGKISKMGINDSTEFFRANGNQFITYTEPHDD